VRSSPSKRELGKKEYRRPGPWRVHLDSSSDARVSVFEQRSEVNYEHGRAIRFTLRGKNAKKIALHASYNYSLTTSQTVQISMCFVAKR